MAAAGHLPDKNVVHSVGKAFRVLEAFTNEQSEPVLAEVARSADLDNATTFRLLNTLVQLGYVEKVPDSRRFRLTLKCLDLGFNAIARSDLRKLARPLLRTLVGQTMEVASVGVLDGANVVYVERIQAGMARLGVDVRIGSRVPAYCSAIGQAILAMLPQDAQIRILESQLREKLTAHTVTDLDLLLSRLRQVRAQGYALSDQETVPGLRVLAAPVIDADNVPLAGLSVATPAFGPSPDEFEHVAKSPVINAARALSLALQAAGGTTGQGDEFHH